MKNIDIIKNHTIQTKTILIKQIKPLKFLRNIFKENKKISNGFLSEISLQEKMMKKTR